MGVNDHLEVGGIDWDCKIKGIVGYITSKDEVTKTSTEEDRHNGKETTGFLDTVSFVKEIY